MALESKLLAVPQQTFTGNGTSDGQVTIADPYLFKIGQVVIIGSPNTEHQIKRIANGIIHVGPFDDNPETRSDVSAYTVGSYIFANEQLRPWIPRDGVIPNFPKLDYTYEEAPTVAQRNLLVDKSGAPVDIIEVSGIRRLAVETSVSVSTTASGVQDVRIIEQPIAVTISGSPAVTVTGVVTTSGIAEQPVRVTNSPPVNIPSPLDVNVVNSLQQHNVTVSGVVNISGIVDFQRPVHVIVDSAPESVATISGVIAVSGVAQQPVRVENIVQISGIVDFQRPVEVLVTSGVHVDIDQTVNVDIKNSTVTVTISGVSEVTVSGIVAVSGVAEQPVRIDHVVNISGVVDIQRPLDVNVISSTPVNVPQPLDVTVINSLPQHNVTVSGVTGVVQVSGIVDFQRPVHVIVDSAPPATFTPPIQQNVSVSGVVNISGVVDFQRPVSTSGIGGEFIQGVADFTKFPLVGSHHTITISYTAPDLIEYVGWAEPQPGLSEASPVWRIARITYSGTSILRFQWAGGNRLFNKVWDDRVTYLYG